MARGLLEVVANYPCGPNGQVLEELEALGVELLEEGETLLGGFRVLGKGTRGVVVAGLYRGMRVAVKIRRCDSPRESLKHEAEMLSLANGVGVGPKLLAATANVLVMELVEGTPLKHHEKIGDLQLARCVVDALEQARRLDEIGLDHGELSRAHSHVYAVEGGAKIIDFDSASTKRRPHNYSSLYSYFFVKSGPLQQRIRALLRPESLPPPSREKARARAGGAGEI